MVATELPAPPLAQTHQIWYLSLSLSLSLKWATSTKKRNLLNCLTQKTERERERKFFLFLRDLNNDLKKIVEVSSGGLISSHVLCSMSWILSSSFFLFSFLSFCDYMNGNFFNGKYLCLSISVFFFK